MLRGYDWYDMIEETEGLTKQDLLWAMYPSDDEIDEVDDRRAPRLLSPRLPSSRQTEEKNRARCIFR